MKKLFFILAFSLFTFHFSLSSAYADVVCQPIYGGGQTCVQTAIAINKMVMNPQTNAFVDNLGVNDPRFAPEQTVTFQITVTNTGTASLSQVNIKDVFPQFVTFLSGGGSFDSNTKTLTFTIDKLNAGESKSFTVLGKISSDGQLPSDQSITCVVNQVNVKTAENQTNQDSAQLCVQKGAVAQAPTVTKGGLKVFPPPQVITTPPTGPEALGLLALIPSGLAGLLLRRKTK